MLRNISIICLSALFITGCLRDEEEPLPEIVYARPLTPYHVVKKGETTLKVAQKYGMDEDVLIKINRLKAPYKLIPGQRLLVHAKATSQPPSLSSEPGQDNDVVVKPIVAGVSAAAGGAATAVMPSGNEHIHPNTDELTVIDNVSSQTPVPSGGYEWPVQGEVIQQFGQKAPDGSVNEGINIRAAANLPVKAIADGVVNSAGSPIPGYGNMIVIKHADGKISVYAHLNEIIVKPSEKVSKGQIIGRVGDTGMVKNNHQLYLHIRNEKSKPIDPLTLLP